MGLNQTKQTERTKKWVLALLARPNKAKYGYWPDQNIGIEQTEETKIR